MLQKPGIQMIALVKSNRNKGLTMVELVVVTGLIGIFATIVFFLFRTGRSTQNRVSNDLHMQSRALFTQNFVSRLIREGREFIVPQLGEEAPLLCFIDKVGNCQLLCLESDKQISKQISKKVFKLVHYQIDSADFDPYAPKKITSGGKVVSQFVKEIKFSLSNAGAANVKILFESESRGFQVLFQCGLMNSGEPM